MYRNKKLSEEHKRKISDKLRGIKRSDETKIKMRESSYWKGKRLPEETRKKLSESQKGEKNHFWRGGVTLENHKIRNSIEFRLWREAIFARDNWTCQKTKIKGGKLHPHHIQNFSQFPELRFTIDNGITLSEKAHQEFHQKYGVKNNTKEQNEKYLRRRNINERANSARNPRNSAPTDGIREFAEMDFETRVVG